MASLPAVLRQRSLSTTSTLLLRVSATSLLRSTAAHAQARSFWGWRRPRDYDSRSDPIFHRFCRYRTLKTRAKLLDKLRRRGRWEWDINQRPFFSPRHIRLASHIGRPRWRNNDDGSQKNEKDDTAEDDGLELSQREKQWKDQMEAMRRRIEQDPYESIFGKRFEPFWSPLVPSWMREEMGLSRWPKQPKDVANSSSAQTPTLKPTSTATPKSAVQTNSPVDPAHKDKPKRDTENDVESPNGQLTSYSYSSKKQVADADPYSPNGQLTNYSYSSSTSWDSWSQKTRREEWDSISGQTRRYEYDPITNRMVQIPDVADATKLPDVEQSAVKASRSPRERSANDLKPGIRSSDPTAIDIPVKTFSANRTAIAVPTQTVLPANIDRKTSVYFPSLLNTSVVPKTTTPAAVAKIPEKGLDILTADEVRASVGKNKQERGAADRVQGTLSQVRAYRNGKPDPSKSEWDQAETQVLLDRELDGLMKKKQKLLDREHDMFHIEGQKAQLQKLDGRIGQVTMQLQNIALEPEKCPTPHPLNSFAEMRRQLMSKYENGPRQRTKTSSQVMSSSSLQPSLERLASKKPPAAIEPDDSAAHESTGGPSSYNSANVPKEWDRQADLLQADRVRRTRGGSTTSAETVEPFQAEAVTYAKKPRENSYAVTKDEAANMKARWIDVMTARKAAYDAEKAQKKAEVEAQSAEKNSKLEKANAMMEAEIKEQKFLMQSHENRYAHKIQSLRQELDTAYKQSSTNADMHVDRIRTLELELKKALGAAGDTAEVAKFQTERERFQNKITDLRRELDTAYKQSSANAEMQVERIQYLEKELENARNHGSPASQREKERYVKKVKALREELDIAFKQSAVQGEKHVERIRDLEKELQSLRTQTAKRGEVGTEAIRAEGDISADAAKYANDNSRWYKQPMHRPEAIGKPAASEIERATQKLRDRALVREVRGIYESRYGTIDVNHRQIDAESKEALPQKPQVVEVETDVDLGKALADYEREQDYKYRKQDLEAEIAAQEREAHEAQAIMAPQATSKMRTVIGESMQSKGKSEPLYTKELPRPLESSIAWEEPPLYKVLAYDSGNDMFSTATTSSNFTDNESPISIPEALSQLYQPARFVPHFAQLQRDGYQVIHGTKDLLVFKKVKSAPEIPSVVEGHTNLADPGILGPNPIDGTTHLTGSKTGRFASPMGFTGDNWEALEGKAQSPSTISNPPEQEVDMTNPALKSPHENYSQPADEAPEVMSEAKRAISPRITREERVFSGGRLKHNLKREKRRHHHEPTVAQVKEWQRKWKSYRSRTRWALGVGLGASVVAYGVGAAAEKKEMKEKERWQQILEGRRARWE